MVFLPHTNTIILLERYCGTITEPGLPVVMKHDLLSFSFAMDDMDEIFFRVLDST